MKINIEQSFDQITDYWSPKVISRVNDQYVKIAKVKGELAWHNHKDEDEECWVMLVETVTTKHTGEVYTPLTKSITEQLA